MGESVGEKLRRLRGGQNPARVAYEVGISQEALRSYEQDRRLPRDEVKRRLARYYGCSIRDLFFTRNDTKRDSQEGDELEMSQNCPYCGGEPAFLYRRGEKIVGCERCITMLDFYELTERG